jgi:hypothetical protein
MHQHESNIKRTEHRNIHEDIGEIFVYDDGAIDVNDERLLTKLRDVLQNAPQIS